MNEYSSKKYSTTSTSIIDPQWIDYFSGLLNTDDASKDDSSSDNNNPGNNNNKRQNCNEHTKEDDAVEKEIIEDINAEITHRELLSTLRAMKNNKAAREDGIPAGCIKNIPKERTNELCNIINATWNNGVMLVGWDAALIAPIYKAGDPDKVSNYRGISILDSGYKILTNIMARRLNKYLEDKNIIKESQAGYRTGRSTRDYMFLVNAIINNQLKQPGQKVYICYVDYQNAFDSMPRNKLRIYSNTYNQVTVNARTTTKFKSNRGKRQRCTLSSTLFNIYRDDVDIWTEKKYWWHYTRHQKVLPHQVRG